MACLLNPASAGFFFGQLGCNNEADVRPGFIIPVFPAFKTAEQSIYQEFVETSVPENPDSHLVDGWPGLQSGMDDR